MSVEKDLVKQLRDAVALDWLIEAEGTLDNDTLTAAADEIERLRTLAGQQSERLRKRWRQINSLKSKRARSRAA